MQNIKKPWQHYTSRANETHNPAHPGGDWYWACWNYFRLSILSNSKKMASPSVPSISRVETSSESSSDSTSTTTSTVSEHSKTSNIINRYSCSVERACTGYPTGFGGSTWTRLVSPGQWQRLSVRSTRPVAYPSTGYLFQLQGTFQAVKLKATTWPRGEFPLLPDDGSRVGNSKHRMVFLWQLLKRWLQYPGTDCIASR